MKTMATEGASADVAEPPAKRVKLDDEFKGKTVYITGGGGQFGRTGSLYFAERGANVVIVDINEKAAKETEAEVVKAVGEGKTLVTITDVTDKGKVKESIDAAVAKFGGIDYLWNNAGYQGKMKPTFDYPEEDFQTVMNINVCGAFNVLKAVSKAMIAAGKGGAIVNTASVAALKGTPTMIAYVSSKAALLGMTMSAAKDLAQDNIRVNAVSPALIGPGFMWERQNRLHADIGKEYGRYWHPVQDELATKKVGSVPQKRLGSPEEVVKSVHFL